MKATHRSSSGRLRATYHLGGLGMISGAVLAAGCGDSSADPETLGSVSLAQGTYHLTAHVDSSIRDDSRGWEVELRVPETTSPLTATGVTGQWYWNFESGFYHTGDGWFVYYFGDDNGIADRNPLCDNTWDPVGGFCHGPFEDLQPGQVVAFRYEYCNASYVADVNGSLLCLSVDLKDGQGYRFISADTRTTPEMYTHTETFPGQTPIVIPCDDGAAKMVRQRRKTPQGAWIDMTGTNTWSFSAATNEFQFTNQQLASTPASWEICSNPEPCSPATDMPDYFSGIFDTTGPVCKRTAQDISGWTCQSFAGRTIEVNNVPVTCGGTLPPKYNGYYYFDISAGAHSYASFNWW